ncbi:MAG: DNA internalization-related competence protein ComEC/Rec2 [Lachnospiraceae bacterium]|nr:DNA internalization-related competence protein ComEC/Rec2 [Lachnospiraceae bacterium]
MKRPLLWAVVSFALGEVISLYADSIFMISIIFIMLICIAFFVISKFKDFNLRLALILFLCCLAGLLNVHLRDDEWKIIQILNEIKENYGNDDIDKNKVDYDAKEDIDISDYGTKEDIGTSDYGAKKDIGISDYDAKEDIDISDYDGMVVDCYGVIYKISENGDKYDLYIHLDYGFNVAVFGVKGNLNMSFSDYATKEDGEFEKSGEYEVNERGVGYEGNGHEGNEYEGYRYVRYKYGDVVKLYGKLNSFSHNSNPGCFDFKKYYKSKNVLFRVDKSSIDLVSENDSFKYRYLNFLFDVKLLSKDKLYKITDKKTAGIYSGILLGDRKAVDELTRLDYQNNGIAHILAISGLHISLIFGLFYKLLRRLRVNRYVAGGIGFLLLFSYALMTGFSMSTLRALCMIVLSLIAVYTGETYDMPVALSAATLIILLYNPFKLFDSSVILSVTAIAGVCVGRYILKHLKYFYYINTWKKKFFASVIMSFSVNLVMFPVVIYIYHEVTPYSVILNLLVIPLMTVVFVAGFFGVITAYFSVGAASFFIKPGEWVLKFYDFLCGAFYRLPFGRVNIGRIYIYQIVIFYVMLVLLLALFNKRLMEDVRAKIYKKFHKWFSFKKWRLLCGLYVLIVLSFCGGSLCYTYMLSQGELVAFIDVGQGDGILLRTESGVNIVIDGGSTSEDELGRYVMLPVIKYYGMAHIDYWFVSHTDKDHISGLLYILELGERSGIRIDNLVFSYAMEDEDAFTELITLAAKNEINVMFMETGDYVTDESFELICAHPDRAYETDDINDASLCLSYISDDCSVLFTGDMGDDALSYMLLNAQDYLLDRYDILKVPHHGSRNSINWDFYNMIDFEAAVISCGENNSYGHPHEEVLEMLDKFGVRIRRTDLEGGVIVE